MLCLSPHAVAHLEMTVESLCMDFAAFVSANVTEVNRIQKQQLLEMIQRGEDQKIIDACSAQIAKKKTDRLGARVFKVAFEAGCLQRIWIRYNIAQKIDCSASFDAHVNGFNEM
jgi:hypothetical protein